MIKYKCLIIEDEPLAAEKVKGFIGKHPALVYLRTFSNPVQAIDYLDQNEVDIIFLDIEMKPLTGIEFLKSVKTNAKIIMTTAHDEYAIEGYELCVSDYLLKPFSFSRFLKAIEKVKLELKDQLIVDYLFVKTDYHLEKIMIGSILYIKGMRDYLQIVTAGKKIMTLGKFSSYEEKLVPSNFARVHKSYLVSIEKIEKIEKNRIYISGEKIPIGEVYRERFFEKINV